MAVERFDIFINVRGVRQVDRSFQKLNKRAIGLNKTLAILRAGLVIFASVRVLSGVGNLVDAFIKMENQLKQVTRNAAEMQSVMRELRKVADATRQEFTSTVDIFFRITRSSGRLRLSFKELIDITETLNQAVAIATPTTEEARNALIQFGQGLAAGAVQGEELRSVSEQLPPLAEIIGREFGVAGGELIALNRRFEGIFTAPRIMKAIADEAKNISKAFGETDATVAQAFIRLKNAIIVFVGNANKATGAAKLLAEGLNFLAENLDSVIAGLIVLTALFAFNTTINLLISSFTILSKILAFVFSSVLAVAGVVTTLVSGIVSLTTAVFGLALAFGSPILGILFLGGVAATGFLAVTRLFDGLKTAIEDLGGPLAAFRKGFNLVVASIRASFLVLKQEFNALGLLVKNLFGGILDELIILLEDALNLPVLIANSVLSLIRAVARAQFELQKTTDRSLGNFEDSPVGKLTEFEFFDKLFTFADPSRNRSLVREAIKIGGKLGTAFQQAFDAELARDPAQNVENFLRSFLQTIRDFSGIAGDFSLRELNELLPSLRAPPGEFNKALNEAKASLTDLLAEIDPYIAGLEEIKGAVDDLEKGLNQNLITNDQFNEILTLIRREVVGVGNDALVYVRSLKLLQRALDNTSITSREFAEESRNLRLDFLDTQTSVTAGIERTLLRGQQSMADFATATEDLITDAFDAAGDALVEFFQTGRLDAEEFFNVLSEGFIRLGLQQAATGLFSDTEGIFGGFTTGLKDLLGLGGEPDVNKDAIAALDSFLETSGLVGVELNVAASSLQLAGVDLTLSASGLQTAAASLNAAAVKLATSSGIGGLGIGGGFSSGAGIVAGLPSSITSDPLVIAATAGGASGLGFAHGGSFTVGESTSLATIPGFDNRIVAFPARDGERVDVTPPGQSPSGGPVTVVFQGVRDFDSFRRSQSQVTSRITKAADRNRFRNRV